MYLCLQFVHTKLSKYKSKIVRHQINGRKTHCLHCLPRIVCIYNSIRNSSKDYLQSLYFIFCFIYQHFYLLHLRKCQNKHLGKTKVNAFFREFHNEFISTPNIPNFNETVVKTFLGANVPLKKLRHPAIRRLFIDMGHPLPSESTSRRIVENIAKEEENQMIYNFTNKDIFNVIDEAEVDEEKYLNILGGHVENPAHTVALESIILQSAPNQTTIVQHIDDCIGKLPIERKNFVLLLSDFASYMIAAGRALKLLYNNLFHVTCVAYLLHNCAETIRNKNKNTDLLISSLKAATVKNPSRRNLFTKLVHHHSPLSRDGERGLMLQ